ncbi:MAG: prepilin-type N-terminal cleavage/methylation domain-containing protein [Candidatus Shapirobacteria bacterium]|jgi:prepilin-type N-terminal cleavage/methylation domain-containing protein
MKNKYGYVGRKTGFSLIELLVVVSIMGVLAAVLMMNIVGARERAKDSKKMQDLNSLKNGLRMYYNDNQSYPVSKAIILGSGFTGYISSIGDTSFIYTQPNGTDSFRMTTILDSGAGNDDINSQTNCGIGDPQDKVYAVCSN